MNTNIDEIQITDAKSIFFRVSKTLQKDGQEQTIVERHSINPGSDTSSIPEEIKEICNQIWTDEVIANFKKPSTKP
jgi:hypothetical protein